MNARGNAKGSDVGKRSSDIHADPLGNSGFAFVPSFIELLLLFVLFKSSRGMPVLKLAADDGMRKSEGSIAVPASFSRRAKSVVPSGKPCQDIAMATLWLRERGCSDWTIVKELNSGNRFVYMNAFRV